MNQITLKSIPINGPYDIKTDKVFTPFPATITPAIATFTVRKKLKRFHKRFPCEVNRSRNAR